MPITSAPPIAIAETSSVSRSPSRKSGKWSARNDHSKLTRSAIGGFWISGRALAFGARPLLARMPLRADVDGVGLRGRRELEARSRPGHVPLEVVEETLGDVALEDLHELVLRLHPRENRVDPLLRRAVALADADSPRNGEELVLRHPRVLVLGGEAEQERVVPHEGVGAPVLNGEERGRRRV